MRESERERERECVCVCVRARVCKTESICGKADEVCISVVCVFERERERERTTQKSLVVVKPPRYA